MPSIFIAISFQGEKSEEQDRRHTLRRITQVKLEGRLTSGVWDGGGVFILFWAMKRMRVFVSGEPRTPMLDRRRAFIWARRNLSGIRRTMQTFDKKYISFV